MRSRKAVKSCWEKNERLPVINMHLNSPSPLIRCLSGCPIYYVIAAVKKGTACPEHLDVIGDVSEAKRTTRKDFRKVHFSYDPIDKHLSLEGRDLIPEHTTQLILYNKKTFANLSPSSCDGSDFQTELLHLTDLINLENRSSNVRDKSIRIVDKTVELITRLLTLLSFLVVPLNFLFKGSAVAQHFRDWQIIFKNGGERTSM